MSKQFLYFTEDAPAPFFFYLEKNGIWKRTDVDIEKEHFSWYFHKKSNLKTLLFLDYFFHENTKWQEKLISLAWKTKKSMIKKAISSLFPIKKKHIRTYFVSSAGVFQSLKVLTDH